MSGVIGTPTPIFNKSGLRGTLEHHGNRRNETVVSALSPEIVAGRTCAPGHRRQSRRLRRPNNRAASQPILSEALNYVTEVATRKLAQVEAAHTLEWSQGLKASPPVPD
jgi:hypothetical protein